MFIPESESEDISVKRTLNQKTGNLNIRYFYKNKPIPAFLLDSKLSEQLAGYSLIEKDLMSVIGWLKTISELMPDIDRSFEHHSGDDRKTFNLIKSLFVSSLSFYGKCFTTCVGRGAQLSVKTLDSEFREAHANYMLYRHSFAAHSGKEKIERAKTILLINPKREYEFMLAQQRIQPDVVMEIDGVSLTELAEHALEKVKIKQEKLNDKIMTDEVFAKDISYWKRKCKKASSINLKSSPF